MIAAASECRVSLPPVIEYDADRADLPLVVVPVSIPSMTTLLRDRLDEFAGLARVRIHTDWTDDEDVLAARMSDATVVMSTGFRASARLLERIAGRVRCITFCGTGAVSFIDLEAARRLGITICNAVHYGDNAVAEHAIALMFEHTHRVGELNARTHQGGWPGADITELSGRTLGIIGPAQLDLMRPGTLLVNTARAELIEPGAMLRRLSRGDIAAAIDVTAPEPLPDDDPLCTLPNLIITPHVAWRSDRALAALVEQNVRSAVEFLKGGAYNVIV